MLRRFLKKKGDSGSELPADNPTYGERLLTETCTALESAGDGTDLTLDRIALTMLEIESDRHGREGYKNADPIDREQFARAYLELISDAIALAPSHQLSGDDLLSARKVLAGFFLGHPDIESDARELLRYIDRQFAAGHLNQARLLLDLFDTDLRTRKSNERNLFFEASIQSLMATRTQEIDPNAPPYDVAFAESMTSPGHGFAQLARWLADHANVRLHLWNRSQENIDAWTSLCDDASRDTMREILRVVAPWQWRLVANAADLRSEASNHIGFVGLRAYLMHLIGLVYCVIAPIPGRRGFEPNALRIIQWIGDHFDCVPTRILPDLHRRYMIEDHRLQDALGAIYTAYLSSSSFGSGFFSPEATFDALVNVHRSFEGVDPNQIPDGDYDLGALIFGQLVELPVVAPEDALRLCRLS